jgi:3',5'-cyclic-AMP phosphodiesterase
MIDPTRKQPHQPDADGMSRRGFLECMAWVGTGLVWTVAGGVLSSRALAQPTTGPDGPEDFRFVQISDSHIGFKGDANPDVLATFHDAIVKINAIDRAPAFVLHTGDLSHTQKPGAFDTVTESLKRVKTGRIFYVPGENDVFADGGKEYLSRYGPGTVGGRGWQSFDYKGVHFIGLVNVLTYRADRLGALGDDQLEWLERDVATLGSSTPIVVFAHVPLWAVYPQWGWATGDGERALSYLKHFGSVTVLNGHIHQVMQKVEGNITFHTAMSTAWPQPEPGTAQSPGPMKVPAERLRSVLGVRDVTYLQGPSRVAIVDAKLG